MHGRKPLHEIFNIKDDVPRVLRQSFSFVRYAVARFWNDNLSQSAAALTYSTLLALVAASGPDDRDPVGVPAFDAARERMTDIFFRHAGAGSRRRPRKSTCRTSPRTQRT